MEALKVLLVPLIDMNRRQWRHGRVDGTAGLERLREERWRPVLKAMEVFANGVGHRKHRLHSQQMSPFF